MPVSRGPLSAVADGVAEGAQGAVTGADGGDDELAAEQPAMREVTATARPSRRGKRELCKVSALLSFLRGDGPGFAVVMIRKGSSFCTLYSQHMHDFGRYSPDGDVLRSNPMFGWQANSYHQLEFDDAAQARPPLLQAPGALNLQRALFNPGAFVRVEGADASNQDSDNRDHQCSYCHARNVSAGNCALMRPSPCAYGDITSLYRPKLVRNSIPTTRKPEGQQQKLAPAARTCHKSGQGSQSDRAAARP